jgi:hypothetical protein
MPLSFKLVGFIINKKSFEIKDLYQGNINLDNIHTLFTTWGLTFEEVQEVKFIIDSEQIKDPSKLYYIDQEEIHNIFVFVFNQEIRQKLQTIFITYGTEILINNEDCESDDEINQPITQLEIKQPIMTREIIDSMNEQTLLLFSDPDFITLLNIYIKKPELFNLLSNYIQNNEMIMESLISDKNFDQISDQEKEYYTNLSIKIINIGFNIPENIIINKLIKFSGHLNLTIRSILHEIL